MSTKFNEWIEHMNGLSASDIPPFPKTGSHTVYLPNITEKILQLKGNEVKLFMVLAAGANEYNQYEYNREKTAEVLGIKYNRGNMSKMFSRLIELEMIAIFGSTPTINPFLVMPRASQPKTKAVLQRAWQDMVEFAY